MATLKDIRTTNWQLSLQGAGVVEEGIADVRQCIDVILRTVKGTDPLRPQFGSDIYQYIDKPVNFTVPNIKKAIIEAIGIWETRVNIVSVTHIIKGHQIQFFLVYSLLDEKLTDSLQLYLNNNDVIISPQPAQSLILQALIPNPYLQLIVHVTLDGAPVLPAAPSFGFATPAELMVWVKANWGFLGNFYLLPDKVILFLNNGLASTGTMEITTLAIIKYTFFIPDGSGWILNIKAPGSDDILNTYTAETIAQMLAWLVANYNHFGRWEVETVSSAPGDFLLDDFTPTDFLTAQSLYQFALYTTDNPGAVLEMDTL